MSHFTVLVIGDDPEAQLQPYHEFESTGESDQYVQNINKTVEAREEYEASIEKLVRLQDGREVSRYDEQFYTKAKESTTSTFRRDQFELPPGATLLELPTKDVEPFSEWASDYYGLKIISQHETPDVEKDHRYGWIRLDARGDVIEVIDRTNPNAHWDWYILGGRWTGYFPIKAGHEGVVGKPGLMTAEAISGYVDQAYKQDIDFERMRNEYGKEAHDTYTKMMAVVGDAPRPESWVSVRDRFGTDYDRARDFYHAQEWIKRKNTDRDLLWSDAEDFQCTEEEYVQRARNNAGVTFAVVKDSQWFAKGNMGWWGSVSDAKDQNEWNQMVNEMIDQLPPDTLLSIYDCHI